MAIKKVLQDKRFKNRELQIMRQLVKDKHSNIVSLKHCFYSQVRLFLDDNCFLGIAFLEFGNLLGDCSFGWIDSTLNWTVFIFHYSFHSFSFSFRLSHFFRPINRVKLQMSCILTLS